ncbi:HEXXH motif domain-containing protein [Sphaerisporangium flaviroseum]|uniref:HEXXH motif domain-containing protein n=1 Tax=Sphaerisporangium flaviroseum TaxID=509199 RepID=A0ABP7HPC6_9ACTN
MELLPHRISDEAFAGLSKGGGGAQVVAGLATAQSSKHRVLVRALTEEAARSGHPNAGVARAAYGLLSDLEDRAPEQVERVLRYPAVGAWAWRTYRSLTTDQDRRDDPGHLGAVTAAAAVHAGLPCRLRLPVGGGTIMLPSLGRLLLEDGTRAVTDVLVEPSRPGAAVLDVGGTKVLVDRSRDESGWQVLRRITVTPDLSLVIDDLDPYRWLSADLVDERTREDRLGIWRSAVTGGWRLLERDHWTLAAETASAIRVLTPIKAPPVGQNSGTSRETFGTIALSEPPSALSVAATFAHEVQHAKLMALLDIMPLTTPDDGSRHYAPWRDDPRPVSGLLQGAYAFLGVSGFWRRHRHRESGQGAFVAEVQFARWREGAHLVTGTLLAGDGLTPRGRDFVTGMRATLESWCGEPVDPAALAQARADNDAHRDAWLLRNA